MTVFRRNTSIFWWKHRSSAKSFSRKHNISYTCSGRKYQTMQWIVFTLLFLLDLLIKNMWPLFNYFPVRTKNIFILFVIVLLKVYKKVKHTLTEFSINRKRTIDNISFLYIVWHFHWPAVSKDNIIFTCTHHFVR